MAYEVVNTSAAAGVVPGQSGYCDVLRTQGIPEPICSELARMSHYDSELCGEGESVSVCTIRFGGETWGVVSRTVPCGVDHTGRMNRLAHHVVVPPSELESTDPLDVLCGFAFRSSYDSAPRMSSSLPTWSGAGHASGAWLAAKLAGWERHVADVLAAGRKSMVLLPMGVALRAMVAEVLTALPRADRWRVGVVTGLDANTAWNQGARLRFLVGAANRAGAAWQAWPGEEAIDLRTPQAPPPRVDRPREKPHVEKQRAPAGWDGDTADRLVSLTPKPSGSGQRKPGFPGAIDVEIDSLPPADGGSPIDIGLIEASPRILAASISNRRTEAVRWGIVATWALMGLLAGALVGTVLWQVTRR